MSRARSVRISRDKLIGIVVALACLAFSAIGLKVYDNPSYMYVDGQRGQTITLERAEVTVGDVQVGSRLVEDGEVKAETTGMFVVVSTTLAVPGPDRVSLNRAQLITADRTYDSWSYTNTLAADPGFQVQDQLVFEVDPAQIDDLTMEIWSQSIVYGFYARARIHLGITPDNADRWRQAARDRDLSYGASEITKGLP